MKKKIGLSYSETSFENYQRWFTLADLGDDLELVLLHFEKNNTEDIAACDGFVLTGGIDVHPAFYGGEKDYPNKPAAHSRRRDEFEKKIYRHSQQFQLPLLGICRGLQLVNVLEGGHLQQDLEAQNVIHRKETADDKIHTVTVTAGSLLHQLTGMDLGNVNSAHHQAVPPDGVAASLLVNAVSGDGIVEGLEWKEKTSKGFLLCVQWHPERMGDKENNPFSQKLKEAFLEQVRFTAMKKLRIQNPATEGVIAELVEDNETSLAQKMEFLKNGQRNWRRVPLPERANIIKRFSVLLLEKKEELATILTSEMGKPLQQARNEIAGACNRIEWLATNAEKYLADEWMTDEAGLKEQIVYEPLGVVGNISAWNYPYLVGVNVFVPALLGGNAVLYKPSEYATLTGLQIEKVLKEAGVPDNVFQVAVGGGGVGEELLQLPLDGYFFTGSHQTGKYIYEKVAAKMVPCQCELGGKDPLYVADDVTDIKAVAAATADGAFYNNGQSCCAVERIYVHQNIFDQYVEAFVKEVASYKIGAPTGEGIYIGPLSRREQIRVLQQQIDDALAKGATLLTGGKRVESTGFYFEPTVLVNVSHDMKIMKEESFGPVIGIMKVESDEEAAALMQDTDYGLTAAVYSSDQKRAAAILEQMNTGTVYWNCCDRVSAALPWSGRKHSGFGATLSHAGLRAFVRPKAYHLKPA